MSLVMFIGISLGFSFIMRSYEFKINYYFSTLNRAFWKSENLLNFIFCVLFALLMNFLLKFIYKYFKFRRVLYNTALQYFKMTQGCTVGKLAIILENKYRTSIKPLIMFK